MVLLLIFEHVQRNGDFEFLHARVPDEAERGNALPYFSSHTIRKCPLYGPGSARSLQFGPVCVTCAKCSLGPYRENMC